MSARLIIAVAVIGATCAEAQPLPDDLRKATDCMLQVLKTTPGVSDPSIYFVKDSPCLKYRPDEKSVWDSGVETFCLAPRSNKPPYQFDGSFPGLVSPGEELDFHVSDVVMKKWQDQCGVYIDAVTT